VRIALCAVIVLLVLSFAAGSARADIEVDFDAPHSTLTLTDVTGGPDDIAVGQTATNDIVTRAGGGVRVTSGACTVSGAQAVCPRAAAIRGDLLDGDDRFGTLGVTVPVSVTGGPGNDVLSGGSGDDVIVGNEGDDLLSGRAGNDFLLGFAGHDQFFGESGDDTIDALDGVPERVECEPIVDGDSDGFSPAVDCDDAAPRVFPGAPEIRENGVDENCDGRDALNLDRDGDGIDVPADCDDADPRVRPNALEIRGNAVDENCDGRAAPFADLAALVSNRWKLERTYTSLRTLVVRLAPKGARIALRCTGPGCPSSRERVHIVPDDLVPVSLQGGFRRAHLRAGARVTLMITAAESVARTFTYTIRRSAPPHVQTVCRAPGEARGRTC
jgi:hypothetical protein